MPRIARNREEIEKTRDLILSHALEIIGNEGYDSLTMRKLGDCLGCAAKTIYNYYSSKEEIYLRVLTRGFETLNRLADKAINGAHDPIERLYKLSEVYISFGEQNANYYNIMFNWDVPKYTDYVGTVLESVAWEEKETAFSFAKKAESTIIEILKDASEEEVTFHILRLWSGLHGIVSLRNSHGIDEYIGDSDRFVKRIVKNMLSNLDLIWEQNRGKESGDE